MVHRIRQPDVRRSLILFGILLVAIGLRFWRIATLPPGFHFDESFEGLEALRMVQDAAYRPIFLTGNFGVPPLNAYLNALTFRLFAFAGASAGPVAMHVTAATLGSCTILLVYALGRELYLMAPQFLSPHFPLWSAAALAVMRWHIHFSRMGIEPVLVPLVWCAVCWLLLRGWRTRRLANFAACGVLLAAGMYAYQGAWIIPFLAVFAVLHLALTSIESQSQNQYAADGGLNLGRILQRVQSVWQDRGRRRGILLAAFVATVLVAPLGWFFYQNPAILLMRPAQLAIVGETGSPADASFFHNVWATAKMFGPLGAPGDLDPRRNLPGAPALNLWLAIPFYVGVAWSAWRFLHPAFGLILVGLVGLLSPGFFSEYAPHFHRILGAAAPVALLCGVGLDALSQLKGRKQAHGPFPITSGVLTSGVLTLIMTWLCVGFVVLGGITSGWNYFKRWAEMPELFYAFDVGFWELGQQIAQQPAQSTLYITPRGADHPTIQFARQSAEQFAPVKSDAMQAMPDLIAFDGRHIFPYSVAVQSRGAEYGENEYVENYVVIDHEDFRTRLLLPGIFPEAVVTHTVVDYRGEIYANIYTRQLSEAAQRRPQHALEVTLGDGIGLVGFDVQPAQLVAGQVLYLQLYWQTMQVPQADWTVFTHLLRQQADGQLQQVAGYDSRPGQSSLPTTHWRAGWRILDEVQILLPTDLAAGEYLLQAGMYQQVEDGFVPLGKTIHLGAVQIAGP